MYQKRFIDYIEFIECYIVYRNNYLCICGRNIKYAKMYHVYLYIYTITEVLFFFTYIFMKNHLVHRIHSFIQCVLCTCLNLKYYLYCVVYLVVCLYIYKYIYTYIKVYKICWVYFDLFIGFAFKESKLTKLQTIL